MSKFKIVSASTCGTFEKPLITVKGEDFIYSHINKSASGFQVNEELKGKEDRIKNICWEISVKLTELYNITK